MLKTAVKNKYVQAVLRGLKPCVTGIILATGIYMLFGNFFVSVEEFSVDVKAIIIFAVLLLAMGAYKLITKKKLSPILIIVISAAAGIVVYGI